MTGEAREPSGDTGPLDGVSVLDASRVLAGPFCAMQLADLGADVVKVERPDVGSYYCSTNRNKRSVTLNLGTEEGRALFADLAERADVLLHNFRVGTMDRWGLDYSTLSESNPGLVYCAISGYGEWGPDSDRPAYDLVLQAEGGMMSITGEPDGQPVRVGVAITDLVTGLYASQSIISALLERELGNGEGQKLDLSLLDSATALNTYAATEYFATGDPPGRLGGKIGNIVPYQVFETADDYAAIAVPSEHIWPKFCTALDREDLTDDERFAHNEDRVTNREILEPELEAEIVEYTTDEVVSLMHEHGVPATAINDMSDVYDLPQVGARGMRATVEHPRAGTIEMPGVPMHFSRTPAEIRTHPPDLGEHTEEVLAELGYDEERVADLREDGVI